MAPDPKPVRVTLPVAERLAATDQINGPSTTLTRLDTYGIIRGLDGFMAEIYGDSSAAILMSSFARAMVDEKDNPGSVPWDEVRDFFTTALPSIIQQFNNPAERIEEFRPIQVAAVEGDEPKIFAALDIIDEAIIAERTLNAQCVAATLLRALISPVELLSIEPGTPARVIRDHILELSAKDAATAREAVRFLEERARERVAKLT